jgi:outer membrane protein assembly factor BamB
MRSLAALVLAFLACTPLTPGPVDGADAGQSDAGVDGGHDGGLLVDAGSDAGLPIRCIEDWPAATPAAPVPGLTGVVHKVVWEKKLGWSGFHTELVLANNRLAFVTGNKLWLLDLAGNVRGEVLDSNAQLGTAVLADKNGSFYFAASAIHAVDADGGIRWKFQLGMNLWQSQETTSTSKLPLLSPNGVLYFAATDGYLYAISSADGGLVWKKDVGLHPEGGAHWSGPGVGDTFFLNGVPHVAADGTPTARIHVDGRPLDVTVSSFEGSAAGRYVEVNGNLKSRMHFFDKCGNLRWSLPNTSSWGIFLAGFDDALFVLNGDREGAWYSPDGEILVGPKTVAGIPWILGADGTVYSTSCAPGDPETSTLSVFAYGADLQEKWSVPIGAPCTHTSMALGDDGVLYLARQGPSQTTITAIQTSSPGLAPTAWPARWVNNRRTGWLESP